MGYVGKMRSGKSWLGLREVAGLFGIEKVAGGVFVSRAFL